MNKLEILKSALNSRNDEVENYQINIDNYTRAIQKIEENYLENTKIVEFRDNLIDLLESSKTEQLKSIIIRDVITEQVKEMEDS